MQSDAFAYPVGGCLLLACRPAAESIQPEIGNLPSIAQESDPEVTPELTPESKAIPELTATPEPTPEATPEATPGPAATPQPTATPEAVCELTQGDYPDLDSTLADAVRKYETCELTEAEAAAELDDYFNNEVLIQANLDSDELTGDEPVAFEKWLKGDGNASTYATVKVDDEYRTYAFLPLSNLGVLSQRDDVADVTLVENAYGPGGDLFLYKPLLEQAKATPTAELPGWLRGYAHPRSYPGLMNVLLQIARDHDLGLTDAELETKYPCYIEDGLVGVNMRVPSDSVDTLLDWVVDNDGLAKEKAYVSPHGDSRKLATAVPPSLLETLGARTDTQDVDNGFCPGASLSSSTDDETRVGTITTQGYFAHQANSWRSSYDGTGVKIGIIDADFDKVRDAVSRGVLAGKSVAPTPDCVVCPESAGVAGPDA